MTIFDLVKNETTPLSLCVPVSHSLFSDLLGQGRVREQLNEFMSCYSGTAKKSNRRKM
jgi:hypothetical protein